MLLRHSVQPWADGYMAAVWGEGEKRSDKGKRKKKTSEIKKKSPSGVAHIVGTKLSTAITNLSPNVASWVAFSL